MESIFLCCFKSCLKGDTKDTEYYDILQIDNPKLATTDAIKKQYKKLSLTLHPDKLAQRGEAVTIEQKQQFLKIKEAYDVLSDPKRRKLYDELGSSGLKMMENPKEVDPLVILRNYQKNNKERTLMIVLILLLFASILILPILFSLKCDGTLKNDAKWVLIWIPMWIVDFIQFIFVLLYIFDQPHDDTDNDNEDSNDENKMKSTKPTLFECLYHLIVIITYILVQIFVLLKLDQSINWSWFIIFIPWYIYEIINIINVLEASFFTNIIKPDYDSISLMEDGQVGEEEMFMLKIEIELKYFESILKQKESQHIIYVCALRIWLAFFLALQLDHIVQWNWGLVFLPIWIYLLSKFIISYGYRLWGNSKLVNIDNEAIMQGDEKDPVKVVNYQSGTQLNSQSLVICLNQCAPLFMAVLLVSRLETSSVSITTFVIILPIFIAIGCCCCAVFFGICMMSCIDMDEATAEFNKNTNVSNVDEAPSNESIYIPPPQALDINESNNDDDCSSKDELLHNHTSNEYNNTYDVQNQVLHTTHIDVDID